MHKVVFALAACVLFEQCGLAQVTAELNLDEDQFIPGQPIQVTVRVINRSGETLKLGGQPDWLSFTVEGKDNAEFERNGTVPVQGEFTLQSAKAATKTVQITPHFNFNKPGQFQINAVVRIPGWDREVVSDRKILKVMKGTKIKEVEFGVPGSSGPTSVPEVRKYTLVKSTQLKGGMELLVQVSDSSEALLFKVTELGPAVSFSEMAFQLDRFSNLHVLWQSRGNLYSYAAVNPEGQLFIRHAYDFEPTRRPRLASNDESGRISVANGIRRKTSLDVPPE